MQFPIEVIRRDLSNPDKPPICKIIDHGDHSDRVWLGKTTFWCLRNNHSITTAPVNP